MKLQRVIRNLSPGRRPVPRLRLNIGNRSLTEQFWTYINAIFNQNPLSPVRIRHTIDSNRPNALMHGGQK